MYMYAHVHACVQLALHVLSSQMMTATRFPDNVEGMGLILARISRTDS